MSTLKKLIPSGIRTWIKQQLPAAQHEWIPGPSIQSQVFRFAFQDRVLEVEAGHTTPLYETISELVDFDSYQLARISWPNQQPVTVMDIGANVGVAALLFAARPGTRVFCFEPLPSNCAMLRSNLERNKMSHAEVIEAAVAKKDGTVAFLAHPTASVAGRISAAGAEDAKGIIQVTALSLASALNLCGGEVFLIKMDCEGGEYDIVDQITPDLASRIRHLTLEIHDKGPERNVGLLRRQLEGLGYRCLYKPDIFHRKNLHHLLASR